MGDLRMNLNSIRLAAASALVMAFATPVMAVTVIDQNQSLASGGFTYLVDFATAEQSFQQTANNIAGAGIFLANGFGTGSQSITIALYDDLPSAGGTLITSGTGLGTSNGSWVDVFWTPVAITAGTTEYLVISSSTNSNYVVAYGEGNPYPTGVATFQGGILNSTYDLTFRTYSDTTFNGAVPEPATWAMMILGFTGVGFMAVRRKSKAVLIAA
jgi:hypothetical protein